MVIVAGVCLWVSIAVECVCVCVCVCGLVSSKCQAWRGGFVFMHLNLYFRYMGSFFPLLPNFSPRRKNQHLRMLYMCFLCKNLLVPGISQSCVLCVLWALSLSLSLSLSLCGVPFAVVRSSFDLCAKNEYICGKRGKKLRAVAPVSLLRLSCRPCAQNNIYIACFVF